MLSPSCFASFAGCSRIPLKIDVVDVCEISEADASASRRMQCLVNEAVVGYEADDAVPPLQSVRGPAKELDVWIGQRVLCCSLWNPLRTFRPLACQSPRISGSCCCRFRSAGSMLYGGLPITTVMGVRRWRSTRSAFFCVMNQGGAGCLRRGRAYPRSTVLRRAHKCRSVRSRRVRY